MKKLMIHKNNKKMFFLTIFWFVFLPANCLGLEFVLKPSMGIDLGWRKMPFADLCGNGHFADHYYHISPYIGLQIFKYLGIQAGFETSNTKKATKMYDNNDEWLKVWDGGMQTKFLSTAKVSGEFIGLTFNSATFWQELIPTKITVFAGFVMLKCKMSHTELLGNAAENITTLETLNIGKKAIPKLSVAVNFAIPKLDGLSLKLAYGIEKTSRFKLEKTTIIPTNNPFNEQKKLLIKLKDSSYITIGLTYTF